MRLCYVDLYTDGACSNNPGAGGWGCVLICKNKQKRLSGYVEYTTNNRMELLAVIEGVKAVQKKCNLTIYTDSAYVYNAFEQGWIEKWKKNGWRNADKKPVANKEMWFELLDLLSIHKFTFVKVKGHADNEFNNLCDKLATDEIKKNTI